MAPGGSIAAARRLHALAVDYTERSRQAQADLVRSFEREAAAISVQVGDVIVEDDDDEALTLTAAGRFEGSVRDAETAEWRALDAPVDIVDFYDPVDLFDDLALAIEEAFPGIVDEGGEVLGPAAARPAPSTDPWFARVPPGPDARAEGEPLESASMTILKDLHAAGVFSDEEFEARKAKLRQP